MESSSFAAGSLERWVLWAEAKQNKRRRKFLLLSCSLSWGSKTKREHILENRSLMKRTTNVRELSCTRHKWREGKLLKSKQGTWHGSSHLTTCSRYTVLHWIDCTRLHFSLGLLYRGKKWNGTWIWISTCRPTFDCIARFTFPSRARSILQIYCTAHTVCWLLHVFPRLRFSLCLPQRKKYEVAPEFDSHHAFQLLLVSHFSIYFYSDVGSDWENLRQLEWRRT